MNMRPENPLLGTWKLKSFVREVTATGERIHQFGEYPSGYLSYSADGRMYAILTSDNRIRPRDANPKDEERVKLHQTLIAYAGTYTLDGDKVTHHVDISWNEARTGTDEVRFYKLEGNTLTITTAPNKSPVDGREGWGVVVWEKVKAPTPVGLALSSLRECLKRVKRRRSGILGPRLLCPRKRTFLRVYEFTP